MMCVEGMEGEFNKYLAVLTNEITYVKAFEKKKNLKVQTMQGELKRNTYHILVFFFLSIEIQLVRVMTCNLKSLTSKK